MTAVLARLYICAIVIIGAFLSAAVEYAPAPRLGRRERRLHAVPDRPERLRHLNLLSDSTA
jgi:hypothetical protein